MWRVPFSVLSLKYTRAPSLAIAGKWSVSNPGAAATPENVSWIERTTLAEGDTSMSGGGEGVTRPRATPNAMAATTNPIKPATAENRPSARRGVAAGR